MLRLGKVVGRSTYPVYALVNVLEKSRHRGNSRLGTKVAVRVVFLCLGFSFSYSVFAVTDKLLSVLALHAVKYLRASSVKLLCVTLSTLAHIHRKFAVYAVSALEYSRKYCLGICVFNEAHAVGIEWNTYFHRFTVIGNVGIVEKAVGYSSAQRRLVYNLAKSF